MVGANLSPGPNN